MASLSPPSHIFDEKIVIGILKSATLQKMLIILLLSLDLLVMAIEF